MIINLFTILFVTCLVLTNYAYCSHSTFGDVFDNTIRADMFVHPSPVPSEPREQSENQGSSSSHGHDTDQSRPALGPEKGAEVTNIDKDDIIIPEITPLGEWPYDWYPGL